MKMLYCFCVFLFVSFSQVGYAQMAGHNTKGDFGMQSGTQAPKGFYIIPLYYNYTADELHNSKGDGIYQGPETGEVEGQAGVVGFMWVSDKTLFGGTYGFAVWPAVTNNALEFSPLSIDEKSSTGLADLYIQPVTLGWNTERADFIAGLGVYAPTGDYEVGGDGNLGLGMWSYEILGGSTVYFDEAKSWHFSALAAYEMHGKKDDTNLRVGDVLTIEGGFGKSFMDGAASVGVAYYAQWKVSADKFERGFTLPDGSMPHKHRVYGIGPEVTLPLASKSKLYGFLNLRYLWESGARSSFEGSTFTATLTFPIPSIPL